MRLVEYLPPDASAVLLECWWDSDLAVRDAP